LPEIIAACMSTDRLLLGEHEMSETKTYTLKPELLEILRCPVAVHYKGQGDNPGKLDLVRDGHWLYCEASGYKYPIRNGIPIMLISEGEKWKDVAVDDLPVPPPVE
jgi:uncharacterized protein YbaR (Trm112 family)